MRTDTFKQVGVICEDNAQAFQEKANELLAQASDAEIVFDQTQPFTMYVLYSVRKNFPESALELLEMLDPDGGHARCEDCPYFEKSTDKRKKWGYCQRKQDKTKIDSRACEVYYIERRKENVAMVEELEAFPYEIV